MLKSLSFIPLTLLLICGCGPARQKSTKQSVGGNKVSPGAYHFIRIYTTQINDSVQSDTTDLRIKINHQGHVSGTYFWVLPGKDRKFGNIGGYLSGDTVSGRYNYQQEGGNYNDSIQIILDSGKAMVNQFTANSLLKDTLLKK